MNISVKKFILALVRFVVHLYELRLAHWVEIFRAEANEEKFGKNIVLCGSNVRIHGKIHITDYQQIIVGNNVHIGDGAYFHTAGGLTICDNTHISRNVTIYTVNHEYHGKVLPYDDSLQRKPVFIGKNVWICMNVSIVPGVQIGDGAIIGMGTVVSKDVPANAIIGNVPPRVLKERNPQHYHQLEINHLYGGENGAPVTIPCSSENGISKGEKLFFVLGTGRSGSTSIASTLSQHPDITCFHEPNYQLIRLSTEYAHNIKSRDQVKDELWEMYGNCSALPPGFYGESDQKLSNLVEILAELFPKAKFIHLIRNGIDTVNSTYSRGWFDNRELGYDIPQPEQVSQYQGKEMFSVYRPSPHKMGIMAEQDWKNMSSFERNTWYWAYWNDLIQRQFEAIDSARTFTLKLEEMNLKIHLLNQFIGAREFDYKIVHTNHALSNYELINSTHWSDKQKAIFNKWTHQFMSKYYAERVQDA